MRPPTRLAPQLALVALTLVLWPLWNAAQWWTLLACYGIAWVLLQLWPRRGVELPFPRPVLFGLATLLLLAPLVQGWRSRQDLVEAEGLRGLRLHTEDRLRFEALPAIAPPLVHTDHPQTFYVHAPGAEQVHLSFGAGGPRVDTVGLGRGVFRAFYDPRRHGEITATQAELAVTLEVDGEPVRRQLRLVRPEPHPRWWCSDPGRGRAATLSEETDELIVLSRPEGETGPGTLRRIPVGDGPTDCAFLEDGLLAVSHRYASALWLVDPDDEGAAPRHRLDLGPFQVRVATDGARRRLAVAMAGHEPGLAILDPETWQAPAPGTGADADDDADPATGFTFLPLDESPDWIVFGASADHLAFSSRQGRGIDRVTRGEDGWQIDARLRLGRPVVTLARSTDGGRLFLAVTDLRPEGEHRGNHFIQDQILTLDTRSWRLTAQHLTARRTALQVFPGNVDSGLSPMGLVHLVDGSLLIAFAGSDEVWWVDEDFRLPPKALAGLDLDLIVPHGVADLGDGWWAASSPAGGAVALYRRHPDGHSTMVSFHGIAASDDELASAPPGSTAAQALQLRRGEHAFYEATRSGISCQSCHLHAGSDHSPHDIGQTPLLPTLTVRGVTGSSPYLRDGSFPRIRDLNHGLAEPLLRGYRRFSRSRPLDLETYVETLPREAHPAHLEAAEFGFASGQLDSLRRGGQAFAKARCDFCHVPPAFTNLSGHPVRTLFPDYGAGLAPSVFLDTPTLLGTHAKGHWLQDGRAHDLEAVLHEHNAADRHGQTSTLSERETAELVAFLRSL